MTLVISGVLWGASELEARRLEAQVKAWNYAYALEHGLIEEGK